MDELTDLEHIRKRPSMYVADTGVRGLHQLFNELLDNSIDQFLANQVNWVSAEVSGSTLEFSDDGPGLPFDAPCAQSQSLATSYLTEFRRYSPTADGHTPHIHLGGWGCGLRIVTALTETCDVTSCRNGNLWHQSFSKGIENSPTEIISENGERGTTFRLDPDQDLFSANWCQQRIDQRLMDAAYLFPGLCVKSPSFTFSASRGLSNLASQLAKEKQTPNGDRIWWFNESTDDLHIQAALAGTSDGETD